MRTYVRTYVTLRYVRTLRRTYVRHQPLDTQVNYIDFNVNVNIDRRRRGQRACALVQRVDKYAVYPIGRVPT